MYHRKYENEQLTHRQKCSKKAGILLLSILLLITLAAGGTMAYLITNTIPVKNTFTPSHVNCEVTESFNGTAKSNVNVTNTGDIDAYIRVKLVNYRVNDQGQHIGGIAETPVFSPGVGWVLYGGYYYYTKPVAPGAKPAADLIDSINLTGEYTDADGGKQVIEVMAEAIQALGTDTNGNTPTQLAWKVTISEGSVTAYSEN